ncbi:hypothetical protein NL676_035549 [Syzygium grande]|nr:hypothetical protein NL676_035549 [Syzygium grande]
MSIISASTEDALDARARAYRRGSSGSKHDATGCVETQECITVPSSYCPVRKRLSARGQAGPPAATSLDSGRLERGPIRLARGIRQEDGSERLI